jgi:hypothetical protein
LNRVDREPVRCDTTTMNNNFDFSGMVKPAAIAGRLLAMSTDGSGCVVSYIVRRNGRKLYGRYDYQAAKYVETLA